MAHTAQQPAMAEIRIRTGTEDEPTTEVFTGRWLVIPDRDGTRSDMEQHDAGTYYGVAETAQGRIAVFVGHCNDAWPARIDTYEAADEMVFGGVPEDIIALAEAALGREVALRHDS